MKKTIRFVQVPAQTSDVTHITYCVLGQRLSDAIGLPVDEKHDYQRCNGYELPIPRCSLLVDVILNIHTLPDFLAQSSQLQDAAWSLILHLPAHYNSQALQQSELVGRGKSLYIP
jgi:hypothetical protein